MRKTSRREALRGGAMLAAALACRRVTAQSAGPASAPGAAIRLGVASYSLRTLDPAQVIAVMKQLRTPYLNLKDVHLPASPIAEVAPRAAAYRAAGLTLTALGTIPFTRDEDEDVRSKFAYCRAAGVPLMVAAPTHATIARVERFAKQYDVRVAIHNHGPEDREWPSPMEVLAAVRGMDARMGCCVDVGHTMRAGVDVVEALKAAGPRLFDLHMKDLLDRTSKESQVAVGEGAMPVRAIFAQLAAMRYAGLVDLEYEIHPEDPVPGMVESFAYMRGVIAGMG